MFKTVFIFLVGYIALGDTHSGAQVRAPEILGRMLIDIIFWGRVGTSLSSPQNQTSLPCTTTFAHFYLADIYFSTLVFRKTTTSTLKTNLSLRFHLVVRLNAFNSQMTPTRISTGLVQGVPSRYNEKITVYKGLPYAASTVGENR